MSLKEQKEAFVTGHTGTTILEILLVCASSPIGILLFHELRYLCRMSNYFSSREEELPFAVLIAIESITILLPMTLCETKLLNPYGVIVLSLELLAGLSLLVYRKDMIDKEQSSESKYSSPMRSKMRNHRISSPTQLSIAQATSQSTSSKLLSKNNTIEYLTFYRSSVSYLTFVAILAVDFPIFPRSFAKTETYGYGLMDIGAGSFCVIGGLVSWFARSTAYSNLNIQSHEYRRKIMKVIINVIPLLMMGLIRLITTKGLEYQEHVSEYGVHWNFFFTLACVNVGATLVRSIPKLRVPILSWVPLLLMYQMALTLKNFQSYIEEAPRHCIGSYHIWDFYLCDFFAANREGVFGSIGYLIIYLACEDIGKYCIWSCRKKQHPTEQGRRILFCAICFWVLHWISSSTSLFDILVSRRSTNSTFILWTIAHNMTILFFIWLPFHFCPDTDQSSSKSGIDNSVINPPIFDAVNRHGLIVFILANLMTGAVNLTMNTLEASSGTAVSVIFCYLCSVGAVALFTSHILDYRLNHKRL